MKLLLVDLSHIFHTRWHATAGQDIDAAFRASYAAVHELAAGFDAVVICCDSGRCWRHELYPQYKAGRTPLEEAGKDQLRRLREKLEAEGMPVVAAPDFEADDVIATLAAKAPAAGYEVTIATGDKDLSQLVGPAVVIRSTNNGGGLIGPEEVSAKFGVAPAKLTDWLALVGDKSDNVAGCPGVGATHATRLLNELGSIANIYEQPDAITPPKIREALLANRQQVLLARKLVSLRFDVPLEFAECVKPREPKVLEGELLGEPPDAEPEKRQSSPPPAPAEAKTEEKTDAKGNGASTAMVLTKGDPRWIVALEPQNVRQLQWFANVLYESGLYRKFANSAAIMGAIMKGRSMGLDMMSALDAINIIEGKPTMGAMPIVGVVLGSGKAAYFDLIETDETHAVWETQRVGRKPIRLEFTIIEAEARGFCRPSKRTGAPSNYVIQPKPMLRKQCGVELARAVYPDVVANVYDPDELEPR